MTNLSKTLREKLDREYEIALVRLVERQISSIDGTNKFLFELWDGSMIESVLMRYKHGNSICISSQVAAGWAVPSVHHNCWKGKKLDTC